MDIETLARARRISTVLSMVEALPLRSAFMSKRRDIRVKTGKFRSKQLFSDLPPKADLTADIVDSLTADRSASVRRISQATARQQMGGLLQTPLRRTEGSVALSRTLHPPGRDLKPALARMQRERRHLQVGELQAREGRARYQVMTLAQRVHPPLSHARAAHNNHDFGRFGQSLRARARVNVNLELSRSGNGVRNGFRRPDGRGSGQFAESALDTLYVARNRG